MSERFEDNQLRAYLTGELPAADAARLEAALAEDDGLEARLLALEPLATPLGDVFKTLPDSARLPDVAAVASKPSLIGRVLPYGLVAGIAGLIGVGLAGFNQPADALTWQEQVAVYQALYVAETVAPLAPTPEGLAAEFERASNILGRELVPAEYDDLPGLTLKRAQVLGFEGQPLIQIAFASETSAPIAFCILRSGEDAGAVQTELSGLPTVHWSEGGFGYMLIGDLSEGALRALASELGATL